MSFRAHEVQTIYNELHAFPHGTHYVDYLEKKKRLKEFSLCVFFFSLCI